MTKLPKTTCLFFLYNTPRNKWMMTFIFSMQINREVFYKLILSFWVCVVRYAQNTQNNKFAISLQYLKKEVNDEVYFWHADKHQVFYKLILSFLVSVTRHAQNTQSEKFAYLCNIPGKHGDEVDFLPAKKQKLSTR